MKLESFKDVGGHKLNVMNMLTHGGIAGNLDYAQVKEDMS